jgi:hypothetical protein
MRNLVVVSKLAKLTKRAADFQVCGYFMKAALGQRTIFPACMPIIWHFLCFNQRQSEAEMVRLVLDMQPIRFQRLSANAIRHRMAVCPINTRWLVEFQAP